MTKKAGAKDSKGKEGRTGEQIGKKESKFKRHQGRGSEGKKRRVGMDGCAPRHTAKRLN